MDQSATTTQTKQTRVLEIRKALSGLRRRAMFAGMLTEAELGEWGRLTVEFQALVRAL